MSHWHVRKSGRKYRPQSGPQHFAPENNGGAASSGAASRGSLATVAPGGPSRTGQPRPTSETQPDLLDAERAAFIRALDAAPFDLPEWEAEFTGSMFQRIEKKLPLTDKMRVQIDRLMARYRGKVTWEVAHGVTRPTLKPVRSTTREAYVPDSAQRLLSPGGGR